MNQNVEDIQLLSKKYWHYGIIIICLVLCVGLRLYHVDYPVIDYHNMKEAHTFMEARHFMVDGDIFSNTIDYQSSLDNPSGTHSDNFPLLGWSIAILWSVFGVGVVAPRLLVILLSTLIVLFVYLVTYQLFKRKDIALLSMFFVTICPLFVFFGRRVFYDVPALLFTLVAVYFFLKWREDPRQNLFIWFVVFLSMAGLTKSVYLIILVPIAAIFPYKRLIETKYWRQFIWGLLLPVSFLLYSFASSNEYSTGILSRISNPDQIQQFFSAQYWQTIYLFATTENFTFLGFLMMVGGFLICMFYIKRPATRFVAVWALSIIPYAFIIGWMLSGHNYYQMPFVPVFGVLVAFCIIFLTDSFIPHLTKQWLYVAIKVGVVLIIIMILYPSIKLSTLRQFDTQFVGLDIAGEFMNKNSAPTDRVFGSGHQDTAFYWYADRQGIDMPNNLSEIKLMEDTLNYKWIFLYQWKFNIIEDEEVWSYIKNNYHLRQAGLVDHQVYYLILEKGGVFDDTRINEFIMNAGVESYTYQLSSQDIVFSYTNI